MTDTKMNPEAFKIYLDEKVWGSGAELSTLLQECGAIISGGSILSSISGDNLNDIDIYVNLANSQKLYTGIMNITGTEISLRISDNSISPPYDSSFMVKNHILARQTLDLRPLNSEYSNVIVDFMIVDDVIPVTDVPKNFDLTFCMNWYDGTDLVFMNPTDVETKTGMLSKDYLEALLNGNSFTIKRLEKYTKKGYTISYPQKIPKNIKFTIKSKKVLTPDIWVTTILLKCILKHCDQHQPFSTLIIFLYKLKKLQVENGNDSLFNYKNFLEIFNDIYTDRIDEASHIPNMEYYNWDIPSLLNVILCSKLSLELESPTLPPTIGGLEVCNHRYNLMYQKYVEDVTGAKLHAPSQGVTGTVDYTPMCGGEVPPFSAGTNNIPDDYTPDDIKYIIGICFIHIIKLNSFDLGKLFQSTHRQLAMQIHNDRILTAPNRMSNIHGEVDIDDDEDTDDYIIPETDRKVPPRCFNMQATGDINTSSWYPTPENILFSIEFYPGAETEIVCTSSVELRHTMVDQSRVLYKCSSSSGYKAGTSIHVTLDELEDGENMDISINDVDISTAYIPFTYGIDGTTTINGYLPEWQIKRILTQTDSELVTRIYDLVFVDTISHTASKFNTSAGTENPNYVSTNHCQAGSSIIIFKVVEFGDQAPEEIPLEIMESPPNPPPAPRRLILNPNSNQFTPQSPRSPPYSPRSPPYSPQIINPSTPITPLPQPVFSTPQSRVQRTLFLDGDEIEEDNE